jgi:hypothetical protein
MPGQPVRSRILRNRGIRAPGSTGTGTGAVRSRDFPDAPGGNSPREEATTPRRDSQARPARQPGAVIMSQGRAPRIAPASIPASPARPGRRPTALSSAAHALPIGLARLMQTA